MMQFIYRAPIGLVEVACDGTIEMLNPMAASLLLPLAPDGEIENLFVVLAGVAPRLRELSEAFLAPSGTVCEGIRIPLDAGPGGKPAARVLSVSLLKITANTLMAVVSDVSLEVEREQQGLDRRLNAAERTDTLTRIPNRAAVRERLQATMDLAASASGLNFAVLFVNCDRFKQINDTHGHAVGDALLKAVAKEISTLMPPSAIPARLGGDEFALLLVDPVTDAQASAVADRLVLLAAAPFLIGDDVVRVGASVGIARAGDEVERHVDEVEALLRSADLAMYRAKTRGRGRAERGAPEVSRDERGNDGRDLDRRLAQALDRGALSLAYQPKFELATGRLLEHEALARWVDDSGPVSPAVFIPAAERSGLIHRLGQWALQEACEQAQTWTTPDGDRAAPVVAVNVSPRQLADPCFVACVAEVLTRTGLPASRLCLEITETAAIHDLAATRHQLHELRGTGVLIALDDFGTGYSSLTLLRVLPIDWVKIDRSFVEDVADDTSGAVLVRLVIEAAHSLGVRVCAEGVERPEQLARLLAMGCDAVQGFLLGVPARIPPTGLPCAPSPLLGRQGVTAG